eukprot:3389494-Amphidinium_carterae.1
MQAAVGWLREDVDANSSRASSASLLKTWELFSTRMFPDQPLWPLTAEKLESIAAVFKAGGYHSFAQYLSKAKQRHIELEFEWTDALDLVGRRCTRSCIWGLGPAKQSAGLDLGGILKLGIHRNPLVENVPGDLPNLVVLGVFHLLREIE